MSARDGMTKAALKAEVRERRIGPNGETPGATSWCEAVDSDRIRQVLDAADNGYTLTAPVAPVASASNAQTLADAIAAIAGASAGMSREQVIAIACGECDTLRADLNETIANAMAAFKPVNNAITVEYVNAARETIDMGEQHPAFALALSCADVGLLFFGEAGSGKSMGAIKAAEALGVRHLSKSFTFDMGAHEIFGFMHGMGQYVSTPFRDCFENGGMFIADEMDNANASLCAGFNLALSNGHCTFPDGVRVDRHPDFYFAATCNTVNGATQTYNGREALDSAFVSRLARVEWNIDKRFERSLALATARAHAVANNRDVAETLAVVETYVARVQAARESAYAAGLGRVAANMARAAIYGAKKLGSGALTMQQCEQVFVTACADATAVDRIVAAMERAS